jgi:hypothetical protein
LCKGGTGSGGGDVYSDCKSEEKKEDHGDKMKKCNQKASINRCGDDDTRILAQFLET